MGKRGHECMTKNKDTEILRMFIAGSRLDTIMRRLKVSEEVVMEVIITTPATRAEAREIVDAMRAGTYHPFLYKEKLGRTELPESKKRKIRQVRISDEEMEFLGNPNSTQLRSKLIRLREIELLCEQLDAAGIDLVPSEWINEEFPVNDPFWNHVCHRTLFNRLTSLAGNERLIQQLTESRKTD